jgi:Fe-S cluster assembly scaffold protein SufB
VPALHERLADVRRRAEAARDRPAPFGPDLDLAAFHVEAGARAAGERAALERHVREAALGVGVDLGEAHRAGSFVQVDRGVLARVVQERFAGRLELAWSGDAVGRLPWVDELWWRLADPGADKYTAAAALEPTGGYCLRALPGERIEEPVQACLLIAETALSQNLHNLVVVEEGAALHVITGCTVHRAATGLHIGVSEFHVKRGGSLTFTMIHRWGEGIHVRPRTATLVEEGGTYVSNYVLFGPLASLQMFPTTTLRGAGARARFQAVLCGRGASVIDIGSRTVHEGDGSASEAVSRTIGADASRIWVRGQLVARNDRCRARLECRGMLVSPRASIVAIPELDAEGVPHAELSHEAAISPIAEEEVAYLMARGLPREEAVAAITRGFLNVDLLGLPPALTRAVDEVLAATPAGAGM